MSAEGGAGSAGNTGARVVGVEDAEVREATGAGRVGAGKTGGAGHAGAGKTGGGVENVAGRSAGGGLADAEGRSAGSGVKGAEGRSAGRAVADADTRDAGGGVEDIEVRDAVSAPDAEGKPRRATRRFPLFTRDTARPEGGGRAAPGDAPAPARQWPILVVLGLVGTGLLITALDMFRPGTLLIGAALLGGAVLRWLLPDVGMLAVRSRFTDIVTYGVLGTAIVLLALMAQPNPLLQMPFLKDALHFTVSN